MGNNNTPIKIPLIQAHSIEDLTEQLVNVCKKYNLIEIDQRSNNVRLPFVALDYTTTLSQARRNFVMFFKDKIYLIERDIHYCIKSRQLSNRHLENLFDIVFNRIKTDLNRKLYEQLLKTDNLSQKIYVLRKYFEHEDKDILGILDFVKWLLENDHTPKTKAYTVCPCKHDPRYLYCSWHNYKSWCERYSNGALVSAHAFWNGLRASATMLPDLIGIHNKERPTKLNDGTTCSKIFTINRISIRDSPPQDKYNKQYNRSHKHTK